MQLGEVQAIFATLWSDLTSEAKRPTSGLLAHYTSLPTMEAIVRNGEFWLSNPLCMNDSEELRFGIEQAAGQFHLHQGIRSACGSESRYAILCKVFEQKYTLVNTADAFDTYVMCFSEHDQIEDQDGKLSMWRGYGGGGSGAAIVLNTTGWPNDAVPSLILAKVHYASRESREAWIKEKLDEFAKLLIDNFVDEHQLYIPVHYLLERFKIFSIFSKHNGFREEQEWRLVYLRSFDREDKLRPFLGYHVGPFGVEPKFKLNVNTLAKKVGHPFTLESSIQQIILGPSIATPLMVSTVGRMFELLGYAALSRRVVASGTPYRPR